MVTVAVYAVLAVVVVAALVALAVLVLPSTEQLAPAPADRTPWALPGERAMTGPDVGRLRLPVTLRGYRFAETDAVLDRLGEEIAYRDTVIATLRAELEGRTFAGGAEAPAGVPDEVPAAAPVDEPFDEPLVELGETPEETEHEPVVEPVADRQPEVEAVVAEDVDVDVDAVGVEAVDAPTVEAEPATHVVGIDEELPEHDDLSPSPGAAPANALPDDDPSADAPASRT